MTGAVVLGVTGGIAAYKAAALLRRFTESGYDVTVVPTASALRFVGSPTWESLSGKPVATDVFGDVAAVQHVRLGREASLVVVAPATANTLAKAACGLSDDLLSALLLTARCPVIYAPAMHTEMWEHPATQDNVALLRHRGALVLEPATGRLTGADSGPGRLPEPDEIFAVAVDVAQRASRTGRAERANAAGGSGQSGEAGTDSGGEAASLDLEGRQVVVSAGGTREYLDPVRYLGNRSSGKQGYALAATAAARGAAVTLVAANVSLPDPAGVKVVRVETTDDLRDAVLEAAANADAVVMAAAPADFRPQAAKRYKIKKDPSGRVAPITLVETPDVLAELARRRSEGQREASQVLVGFAAETGDEQASAVEHGTKKLARKGCDLLVVNDVAGGAIFGSDDTTAVILRRGGEPVSVENASKRALSHRIWDCVVDLLVQ